MSKEIKQEILNLIKDEEDFNKKFGINTKVDLLIIFAKLKSKTKCVIADLVAESLENVKSYKYGHTKKQMNQEILKVMNKIIAQPSIVQW